MTLSQRINETLAVPLWVIEEIEKLEAERGKAHAAKTRAEEAELAVAQELDEVKADRDALAAHVERLEDALNWADYASRNDGLTPSIVRRIREVLNATPTTSLARRDARVAAEALERYSRIITEEWIDKGENYGLRTASGQALLQAAEFRRQAEETNHDH